MLVWISVMAPLNKMRGADVYPRRASDGSGADVVEYLSQQRQLLCTGLNTGNLMSQAPRPRSWMLTHPKSLLESVDVYVCQGIILSSTFISSKRSENNQQLWHGAPHCLAPFKEKILDALLMVPI